jgi:4a-hydroxytetrahydrobiopterin dehydratase
LADTPDPPQLPARCEPCEGGIPALSREQAEERVAGLHAWELVGWDTGEPRLRRRFELRDFRAALAWVNRVGELAEEQGHHPDLHITGWNHVEIVLWTHAVGGLSLNDFVLAREIDALEPA